MGQFFFFAVLVIALIAGVFAYIAPSQKAISPMKFVMDNSGLNSLDTLNRKRSQQINTTTDRGLLRVRSRIDELAQEQSRVFDTIQDQQQALKDTNKDLLQLQALTSQMQDEQRLLVAHGQDLMVLNDQLAQSRKDVADQIDLAKINTQTSSQALQQRYAGLNSQAAGFFDKVTQYNQEVRDQMDKIQGRLRDAADNAASNSDMQQQNVKEHVHLMMARVHEGMRKLADSEERSRNLLKDAEENMADAKDRLNDSLQRSKDLMEEEHQKEEDQQQTIADQMQRLRDQENR